MAAKDARVQPIYNCKHREYIELVDSDGAPIALASGDTELSKDGAAFTDSAVEMSEISTGFCSLDFPYSEMAYTCVVVVPKSTGALTRVIKLFPRRLPVLRSGTAQAGAAATMTLDSGASAKDGAYVGCLLRCSNNTPAGVQGDVSKIIGYVGATRVATVADAWTDTPTSSTTFEILVPSDMSLATLLADAAGVVDEMETQMQADPTGFHVNVKEVNGTAQTAGDVVALANTAAAWGSINSGLAFRGPVSGAISDVSFTIGGLAGQGAGAFVDAGTPWYAYVFRDAGGAGGAPQGEAREVTGYTSATGMFVVGTAFSVAPGVGDDIVIMSYRIAATAEIKTVVDTLATPAQVNAEVVDALATDTYAEPGQGAPGATISLAAKIGYLFKQLRNKKTNDGSDEKLYNDAGDTVDQKSTISSAAGVVTKGEMGTGA